MVKKDFEIVRGNVGTSENKIGIVIKFLDESGVLVDIQNDTYDFTTAGKEISKSVGSGITIKTDNSLEISITVADSLLAGANQGLKYQLENTKTHRTEMYGTLHFKEGGEFNDDVS